MQKKNKRPFLKYLELISATFLNGLIALLPLTLTVALFSFSLRLLKSWLEPIHRLEPTFMQRIPHSEIILVVLTIFIVGIILRVFILRTLAHGLEALIFKIPLVRPVYSGIRQLVQAFGMQDKVSFKSVVMVEFPRLGMYSIGFLTGEVPQEIAPGSQRYFNVFVPTTPNPTTGFLIMVLQSDIKVVDLTRHEAMALIISGGIIQPDRLMKKE